jgi:hypothetical protein
MDRLGQLLHSQVRQFAVNIHCDQRSDLNQHIRVLVRIEIQIQRFLKLRHHCASFRMLASAPGNSRLMTLIALKASALARIGCDFVGCDPHGPALERAFCGRPPVTDRL